MAIEFCLNPIHKWQCCIIKFVKKIIRDHYVTTFIAINTFSKSEVSPNLSHSKATYSVIKLKTNEI